jgi:hypothetical protein
MKLRREATFKKVARGETSSAGSFALKSFVTVPLIHTGLQPETVL